MTHPYTDDLQAANARAEAAEKETLTAYAERDELQKIIDDKKHENAPVWFKGVAYMLVFSVFALAASTALFMAIRFTDCSEDEVEQETAQDLEVYVERVELGQSVISDPSRAERVYVAFELSRETCVHVSSVAGDNHTLELWQPGASRALMRSPSEHRGQTIGVTLPTGVYRVRIANSSGRSVVRVEECPDVR